VLLQLRGVIAGEVKSFLESQDQPDQSRPLARLPVPAPVAHCVSNCTTVLADWLLERDLLHTCSDPVLLLGWRKNSSRPGAGPAPRVLRNSHLFHPTSQRALAYEQTTLAVLRKKTVAENCAVIRSVLTIG